VQCGEDRDQEHADHDVLTLRRERPQYSAILSMHSVVSLTRSMVNMTFLHWMHFRRRMTSPSSVRLSTTFMRPLHFGQSIVIPPSLRAGKQVLECFALIYLPLYILSKYGKRYGDLRE
jgi:hypothetical protein